MTGIDLHPAPGTSDRRAWGLALAGILPLAIAGACFATVQQVWIDESTQLSGVALPFARMIRWLAGAPEALGVPPDRMPPVGYALDWLWRRVAGPGELGFRLLHLAVACGGLAILLHAVARRFGVVAGIAAALLLAATPASVDVAVEVRAYPLFLAATALQLVALLRLFDRATCSWRDLVAFALLGVLVAYVHFFGVVATCAYFCGLIGGKVRTRRELDRVLACWAGVLVSYVGLLPFIAGSVAISGVVGQAAAGLDTYARYPFVVLGHPALLLVPAVAAIYFVLIGLLLGVAVVRLIGSLRAAPWAPDPIVGVAIAVLAGLVATTLATAVLGMSGFNPLKPSYGIWLWPPIAVVAASACGPLSGATLRRLTAAAVSMLAVTLASAQALFLSHAAWYAHGPGDMVAAQVEALRGERTAVVLTGPHWAFAHFPLVYHRGGRTDDFLLDGDGSLRRIVPIGDAGGPALPPATLAPYRYILLVAVQARSGADLRALRNAQITREALIPTAPYLPGWTPVRDAVHPGLYTAHITCFAKAGDTGRC